MRIIVRKGDVGTPRFDVRPAIRADEKPTRSLLRSSEFPDEDVRHHVSHFVVASREGRIADTIGLEVLGASGLPRSLATSVPSRRAELATRLVASGVGRARELGVPELWLLTTTAGGFFAKPGFRTVSGDLAPPEIQSTREFRALCPASAMLMR